MPETPRQWLIVGSGAIALRHIECASTLTDGARFARLSSSGASARCPEIDDRVETVLSDWASALNWEPDVAVVANAAVGHVPALKHLIRARVPTLVEKPLSNSLESVEGLATSVSRSGVPVVIGYCLRFHPAVRRVVQLVEGGDIGQPILCRAHVGQHIDDWRATPSEDSVSLSPEMGGGALLELSHEIDLALWLMGEPSEVAGIAIGADSSAVEMATSLQIRHADGMSSISMNMLERPAIRQLSVIGTRGSVHADLIAGRAYWADDEGAVNQMETSRDEDMYLEQMRHFIACVRGDETPMVDISAATRVLTCIDAVRGAPQGSAP